VPLSLPLFFYDYFGLNSRSESPKKLAKDKKDEKPNADKGHELEQHISQAVVSIKN
jgi:hypothetical protein